MSSSNNCLYFSKLIQEFFSEIHILEFKDECLLTLPLFSFDQRSITIHIKPFSESSYLIHDGGKTLSEFWSQGLYIDSSQALTTRFEKILQKYDLKFRESYFGKDVIFKVSPKNQLKIDILVFASALISISTLLVEHKLEPVSKLKIKISSIVEANLHKFTPKIRYMKEFKLRGQFEEHKFDFVLYPLKSSELISTIDILPVSPTVLYAARLYSYKIMDMRLTNGHVRKIAILHDIEKWRKSERAMQIIRKASTDVLEFQEDEERYFEEKLTSTLASIL